MCVKMRNIFYLIIYINLLTSISFFFFALFFNWRVFSLQNFVVFCHTPTRISHTWTHVPSLLNLLPISLPTLLDCHRAPVWLLWAIQHIPIGYFTFGIVSFHATLSTHLTLSLLPSPSVLRSVLSVCVSIAALKINSSVQSF